MLLSVFPVFAKDFFSDWGATKKAWGCFLFCPEKRMEKKDRVVLENLKF